LSRAGASLAAVSRALLSEPEAASLRRGAVSWLCALVLIACVLLSTSAPNGEFDELSFGACVRADFAGVLGTCTLATTSDVRPTTGDPFDTKPASEVSKERASPP